MSHTRSVASIDRSSITHSWDIGSTMGQSIPPSMRRWFDSHTRKTLALCPVFHLLERGDACVQRCGICLGDNNDVRWNGSSVGHRPVIIINLAHQVCQHNEHTLTSTRARTQRSQQGKGGEPVCPRLWGKTCPGVTPRARLYLSAGWSAGESVEQSAVLRSWHPKTQAVIQIRALQQSGQAQRQVKSSRTARTTTSTRCTLIGHRLVRTQRPTVLLYSSVRSGNAHKASGQHSRVHDVTLDQTKKKPTHHRRHMQLLQNWTCHSRPCHAPQP